MAAVGSRASTRGGRHVTEVRLQGRIESGLYLIRRVVRRLRRWTRTLSSRSLKDGGLTDHLVDRYCRGRGLEVGPGHRPYGPLGRTLFLDNLEAWSGRPLQVDIVAHAQDLPHRDGCFDYLVSSHCLEHCPDTLRTLSEWHRVLRPGGHLILILPHMLRTFDRFREVSTYNHHHEEVGQVDALDADHWESFEACVAQMSPIDHPWMSDETLRAANGRWDRAALLRRNLIHYHAWTQHEMSEIVLKSGFRVNVVLEEMPDRHDSFLIVASATADSIPADSGVIR